MNIVLLGYRGSGKTTVGKKLANALWRDFVDTDAVVVKRFGDLTIRQIWEKHGEPAFRDMECTVAAELLAKDNQVIALGGGTVMQPAARTALESARAIKVYLYCEPQVLAARIAADADTAATRPNLTPLAGGVDEVTAVLAQRDPVYRAVADHVLDVTTMSPEDAVRHLIQRCL